MSYNTSTVNALLQLLMGGSGAFDPKTGMVTPATGANRPGMTPPIAPQGQGQGNPSMPSPPMIDPSMQIQGAPGPGGPQGPVIDTRLSGGAPNRADHFNGIGKYQDLPQYQPPTRDLQGEAKQNLLGVGATLLGTLFGGGARNLAPALQGYMNGATSAQDQAYQNREQQAQGVYGAKANAINSANQNVTRQTADAQNAFNDAQQDYRLNAIEQDKANALKAGATKQAATDRTTFLGRFTGATTGGKTTSAQRAALIQLTPPAELARMGFQPDGSDLIAAAKPIDDELDAAAQKTLADKQAPKAQAAYLKRRQDQVKSNTAIINTPGIPADQKAAARDMNNRIYQELGIGVPNQPIPPDMTPAQADAAARADRDFKYRVQHDQTVDSRRTPTGQITPRDASIDYRDYTNRIPRVNKDIDGYRKQQQAIKQQYQQQSSILASGQVTTGKADSDGNPIMRDITPEERASVKRSMADARDNIAGLESRISDSAAMRTDFKNRATAAKQQLDSTPVNPAYGTQGISKGAPGGIGSVMRPVGSNVKPPALTVTGGNGGPAPKVTLSKPLVVNGKSLKHMTNDELMALAMKGQGK